MPIRIKKASGHGKATVIRWEDDGRSDGGPMIKVCTIEKWLVVEGGKMGRRAKGEPR
jgi:hypothetical protein